MFGMRLSRRFRRSLAGGALIAASWVAPGALAQTPEKNVFSPLDRVRQANEITAQKLEMDVNSACREADRLSPTDRHAAVARLKAALAHVEAEPNLSTERRDRLVRLLNVKIRFLNLTANRTVASAPTQAAAQQRRLDQERRAADDETIARTLETIRNLRQDGKHDEARHLADELARRFPSNPAAAAANRTSILVNNLSRKEALRTEQMRGDVGTQRELQQAATPPAFDLDFPKDWQERIKNRSRGTPMTEKEKAILKALDTPVVARFRSESFENAIKFISDKMKQPILIDRIALEEAQVNYETPISLETPPSGLAARTLLRRLLGDYGLAYVIKDQAIEVTTNLKAKNTMVVRSYFIGDLLNNPSLAAALGQQQLALAIPGVPGWNNPSFNQALVNQQATQIVDMIKESVEPESWRIGGGNITFHAATMSLVVRQSAEVHAMLSGGLLR